MARRTSRSFVWRGAPIRRGLGRRILRWFLVLSLIPLIVTNSLGYLISRDIIEEQTRRYLNALTDGEARHVAAEVARHQASLTAFTTGNRFLVTSIEALTTVDPSAGEIGVRLSEYLDRQRTDLRPMAEIMVVDTTGMVIAATKRTLIGSEWPGIGWFRGGRDGRFYVDRGSAIDDEHESEPMYRIAASIRRVDGSEMGILVAGVGFEELQEFLSIPPHLAGDVHTYLVDSGGKPLVVSHRHGRVDYDRVLPVPVMGAASGAVTRYANFEGDEVLGTTVAVPGTDWRYVSEVSVASAFGQLRRLGFLAISFEAVFVFLLVAVVWIVAGSIIAPLHRLVAAAERIRGGDLGAKVEIDREDEIGELGRTFNQMSKELSESSQRITELHDQEMRRAAQLASVGELASGIAHEIKNPLVGMRSGVDLLSRELGSPDSSKTDGILREIRAQLRRMEGAIRDLLSYARPKPPRLTWASPSLLVQRVIPLVRPQADAAGVSINTELSEDNARARVDPELMTQALVNLALNGIQAMQSGATLEIATKRVGPEVHISISDSGSGIPEDRLAEIFRPFVTSKHQGTGLGLAITRGIVERHGGRLEVESTVGEGSSFRIILPGDTGTEMT